MAQHLSWWHLFISGRFQQKKNWFLCLSSLTKICWTQKFFGPKIFWLKVFLDLNFFGPKLLGLHFFLPNFILDPTLLGLKFLLDMNCFWIKNCSDLSLFDKNNNNNNNKHSHNFNGFWHNWNYPSSFMFSDQSHKLYITNSDSGSYA